MAPAAMGTRGSPLHVRLGRPLRQRQRAARRYLALHRSTEPLARRIGRRLIRPPEPITTTVETARLEWLGDHSQLIDGTLGDGGIWDRGHTVAEVVEVSKDRFGGRLLWGLAAELAPRRTLELGTNVGVSSAYLADAMPAQSRLVTIEASPYRSRLAGRLHETAGLSHRVTRLVGRFDDRLDAALSELASLDLVFIDGDHTFEGTMKYVDAVLPSCHGGSVISLDDITWSEQMRQAWAALVDRPEFVALAIVDMGLLIVS